jgi:hypothetical protein
MPAKPKSEPMSLRAWLFKAALVLIVVAAILGGLIWAGHWGSEHLRGRTRYDLPFTAIECEPPAGMDRSAFLDEVRYYARSVPEQLHLLDDDLRQRLHDAFAAHPWVERVASVEITPPKRIVVRLVHRTPVLAVRIGVQMHAVDASGVLLPGNAPTRDLPVYDGDAKVPAGIGKRWGDADVEAAARKLKSNRSPEF